LVLAGLLAEVFNLRTTLMLCSRWRGAGFFFGVVAEKMENVVEDAHDESEQNKHTPNQPHEYRNIKSDTQPGP